MEQHPRVRLGPPHRARECGASEGDVLEGLILGRDRWHRNCTCCMVTVTYGTPGTYRTPPNGHQGQLWVVWMVRAAATVASLLNIPRGVEHPLQDSHRFAVFPGPDDDVGDDIKPCPEPVVGEGAVLL